MKKIVCLSIAIILVIATFVSCGTEKGIDIGSGGILIGELPYVFFSIRSNETEFDLDNVTLEISFGNGTSSDVGRFIGEGSPDEDEIKCIAVYFCNGAYLDKVTGFGDARFDDYKAIDGLYFVREISVDDYNENYDVDTGFLHRRYEHSETLTVPRDVFEKRTGYACIVVAEIALEGSSGLYRVAYSDVQGIAYEVNGERVTLSEPGTTNYTDPRD